MKTQIFPHKQSITGTMLAIAVYSMATGLIGTGPWQQVARGQLSVCNRIYTLDADFDEGNLVNVNHNAPNQNQLQLNQATTPFPFVNIACSARGTAVRIDVNTGQILGEYLTAPNGMGRDPSRTTVDQFGNVWLSNRAESGFSGGQPKGSVTRIGLIIGGTRGNKNLDGSFTPNPTGQYLAPPFQYSTCQDRDGDGLIKTSRGLGNFLPWTNAGGANTNGGVSTAEDECIINYTRVTGTQTRTVAIDANNDVWVGGLGDLDHEKLNGTTGLPVPGTQFNVGAGGYGGLIDGNGVLWSARGGSGLLWYDTSKPVPVLPDAPGTADGYQLLGNSRGDYGLGIDPNTGHVWHTTLSGSQVVELDSLGNVLNRYAHGNGNAQGVAVDSVGNVWVAHSLFSATTVGHIRTNGTLVGNVALPGGNGPTGVAVDANGKIWVANINSNNAQRIDPNAGPIGGGGFRVGAVDLTVNLGAGAGPYNYSDMTGFVAIGSTAPSGNWTVVHDSGQSGTGWGTVCWNSNEPPGTSVAVEVRSADTQIALSSRPFVSVSNCISICGTGVAGRFIEIRTTLSRAAGVNVSPALFDLTVQCCGGAPVVTCSSVRIASGRLLTVSATDDTDPNPSIFIKDSASAFVAGPFRSGDQIHVRTVPAPSAPSQTNLTGAIKARVQLRGSPLLFATDAAGNASVPIPCP